MIKLFIYLISAGLARSVKTPAYSSVAPFHKKQSLSVVNKHDLGIYVITSYHELYKRNYFCVSVDSVIKKNVYYLVTIVVRPTD